MTHKVKRLFCCTLAMLMAVFLVASAISPSVIAADTEYRNYRKYKTTIRLSAREEDSQYELSTKDLYLFSLENTAPGDTWYGAVKVENDTETDMAISVQSITSNLEYDTLLFDTLDLRINVAGKSVYRGPYAAGAGPVTDYYVICPGDVLFFDIKVSIPETADNSCQGRQMDSTWTFKAVFFEPEATILDYTVHYIDRYFQDLHAPKIGHGYPNEVVTEYAPEIEGYQPDAQAKQLLLEENGHNDLYFIYYPEDTGAETPTPTDPIEPPGTSAPIDPSDDIINTGFDLTGSTTALYPFLFILFFTFTAIILIILRIRRTENVHLSSVYRDKSSRITSEKEDT